MRTFMWSWTKFIVGVAVDRTVLPSLDQRINGMRYAWFAAIHLGFLTIVFEFKTEPITLKTT